VPVVDIDHAWQRPGGAGLAALLAARSVPEVVLVTALGRDEEAHRLRSLLEREVTVVPVPLAGNTVCKKRVRVARQSLLRLDSGDGRASTEPLDRRVGYALRAAAAILVADYGRGLTAHPGVRALLAELACTVPVVWDPHPKGSPPVAGSRLVTPNESEALKFLGTQLEPLPLARALARRWRADAVAVTVGRAGAALHTAGGEGQLVPVPSAVRVSSLGHPDSCGAGDRFAAEAAAARLAGESVTTAVVAAVDAASRFISAGGAATLSTTDVGVPRCDRGTRSYSAFEVAARVRRSGGRLVATGGCFDLLHAGHVSLLRRARALGDALIVCLNSDESVRRLKGPNRPIVPAADRIRLLAELISVDAVVVFDEPSPAELLDRLRPEIWVKGGDYSGTPLPEAEVVTRHGGEVVLMPMVDGYSTTHLVDTARAHTPEHTADRRRNRS
jgi:rfaE bifunctional protein nucleotidyltransferase chain/domain